MRILANQISADEYPCTGVRLVDGAKVASNRAEVCCGIEDHHQYIYLHIYLYMCVYIYMSLCMYIYQYICIHRCRYIHCIGVLRDRGSSLEGRGREYRQERRCLALRLQGDQQGRVADEPQRGAFALEIGRHLGPDRPNQRGLFHSTGALPELRLCLQRRVARLPPPVVRNRRGLGREADSSHAFQAAGARRPSGPVRMDVVTNGKASRPFVLRTVRHLGCCTLLPGVAVLGFASSISGARHARGYQQPMGCNDKE